VHIAPETIRDVLWPVANQDLTCSWALNLPAKNRRKRTAAGGRDEVILSYPFIEAIAIQRAAHVLNALEVRSFLG
jgi:hypothetical protein